MNMQRKDGKKGRKKSKRKERKGGFVSFEPLLVRALP